MEEHLEKSLIGACGVFCVSAELSRKGWIAMPTIRNTAGVDIIAFKGSRAVKIQVKTNSYGKVKYPMSEGNESLMADDLFYVFVTLKAPEERPDFYIAQSGLVADYIKKTHTHFATLPPRRKKAAYEGTTPDEIAQKREKSTLRQFPNYVGALLPEFKGFNINNFKDGWELLEK